MPSETSDGHQAWNPSVGLHYKPGKEKRESYGGIVAAMQDTLARGQYTVKAYPENFAGIIAAIQDLRLGEYQPGSDIGPLPPGDGIDNTDPDNPIYVPGAHVEGQLWFDTRQGRLFVYTDNNWTQCNGADGLPVLLPNTPTSDFVVPGQLWWNTVEEKLYIFSGEWIDTDGEVATPATRASTDIPVWKPIEGVGGSAMQTTATLPLAATIEASAATSLPDIDMSAMNNQNDFNQWLYDALVQVNDTASAISSVVVGTTPPSEPDVGQLWYDTNTLDMSIWYDDGQSQQWVPTSTTYTLNEDINALSVAFNETRIKHNLELLDLNSRVDKLDREEGSRLVKITQDIAALDFKINELPTYDLSPYALTADVVADQASAVSRIAALEATADTLNTYQTKVATNELAQTLTEAIAAKVTPAQLNAVVAQIPSVSQFVTQSDIDSSVAGITSNFLPRNGGTINGHFVINKSDVSVPAFDVSGSWSNSKNLLKLKSYSPDNSTATFGSTDQWWQYAWDFAGQEDFAWVHDGTKVFSVSKDGPACSALYIGQFTSNDQSGRRMLNTIEVGEVLRNYKQVFADIRQAVSQSTDYDTLKAALLSALPNS